MIVKRTSDIIFCPDSFFHCTQTGGFSSVFYPEKKRSMAGFCIWKDDKVPVKAYCYWGHSDGMNIEDLETRLDINILGKMLPDVFPAFFEGSTPHKDLIVHRFYAAHGVTSSIAFFRGRGLCTAFAAIIVQGKSIFFTRSS